MFQLRYALIAPAIVLVVLGLNEEFEITFDEFEQCLDEPDTPLSYENVHVEFVGKRDVVVDGKVILTQEIPENLKAKVTVIECENKDQKSSCYQAIDKEFTDICTHIKDPNAIWADLVNKMEGFDPNCPIKAGEFNINKAPLNASDVDQYPLNPGYFTVKVEGLTNDHTYMCIEMSFYVKTKDLL